MSATAPLAHQVLIELRRRGLRTIGGQTFLDPATEQMCNRLRSLDASLGDRFWWLIKYPDPDPAAAAELVRAVAAERRT